ncbi:NRDE-2, necessary for RNA interference-domain-containing protein [Halteromyces radiatus]|uniref:NRDE-2, necessary for RNA interference-domain-containing protein n=1 Tax=Halteromyces radiatus TaxID=101107 RepID=UPI002220CAB7|nr:NRDE-2, necessary for RNA interference-domain-containing protein [Halteromyces radiatus]KAI8088685.1 NRDE-2, necessary for RNA interference-domain-containing protein [Halteromyces radiatus]
MGSPSIPPPPSFKTAPDIFKEIPTPSFASAPQLEDLNETDKKQASHREKETKNRSSSSPRRDRSQSPSYRRRQKQRHSRKRSRSPSPSRHHRSKSQRSRSQSPRKRKRSKERSSRRSPSPPPYDKLESGLAFYIDKRGDPETLKYGPNLYTTPIYHRSGRGRVIGLSQSSVIDPESAKAGKSLDIIQKTKSSKQLLPRIGRDVNWPSDRQLVRPKTEVDDNIFSSQFDFVDMADMDEMDGIARDDETHQFVSSGLDYRTIEGKSDTTRQDINQDIGTFDNYVRNKTVQYNNELSQDPTNVKNWLAYIDFQDEIASGRGMEMKNQSRTNKNSMNVIKLCIFDQALEHNPEDEDLWLAYLRCGEDVWDTVTKLQKWDKALARNPNSIRLWADYINLRQTSFISYSFDDCVKVFEDCLHTLHMVSRKLQLENKNEQDHLEELENIESLMVYVVLRLCLFMKQAGYQERAFASIQALVEFCLFQPLFYQMSSSISLSRMIADFADFWDSEVPRFGEPEAKGWHIYYEKRQNGEEIPTVTPKHSENDHMQHDIETIEDWLQQEKQQEKRHVLPRRMEDTEQISIDDDPFRMVLSEDVTNILFNITTEAARKSLIYSIFVFLGLPYSPPGVGTNTHFSTDTFTRNDLYLEGYWPSVEKQQHQICYVDGVPMKEKQQSQQTPFSMPVSYPVNVEELFARHDQWFHCLGKQYLTNEEEIKFTRYAFEQLLNIEKNDSHLAMCYLSFESSYGYKAGRKLAKRLLNDQRTNIKLWNAYAQMEKSHDRPEEARKVYQLALTAAKDFSPNERRNIPLLYRMYAQMELEYNRPEEALNIIFSLATGDQYVENSDRPTKSRLLQAKEYFKQESNMTRQHLTETDNATTTAMAYESLVCYGLFVYLVDSIDSAVQVYEDLLDYLRQHHIERGFFSEKVWVAYVELLHRHSTKRKENGYRPGLLRQACSSGLELFPNNTILLGLFMWNESRTWIYNRVQDFFTRNLERDPNIILWLGYTFVHLHRQQPYDVNLIRTIFEEAVEHPRTRASILLWKLYIEHELRLGNMDKAKTLLYRSVRACPWSKDLFLYGLQHFNRTMTNQDLLDWTSLMMEKDIRTRWMIDQETLFELE